MFSDIVGVGDPIFYELPSQLKNEKPQLMLTLKYDLDQPIPASKHDIYSIPKSFCVFQIRRMYFKQDCST
jgi:hypothetical protein